MKTHIKQNVVFSFLNHIMPIMSTLQTKEHVKTQKEKIRKFPLFRYQNTLRFDLMQTNVKCEDF